MAVRSRKAGAEGAGMADAAKPRRRARKSAAPTYEQIAERAYFIALEGGGDEVGHWLRAEQELSS
jgi:hypothetical protein